MNVTRIYRRASTDHQDATRARAAVEQFALWAQGARKGAGAQKGEEK